MRKIFFLLFIVLFTIIGSSHLYAQKDSSIVSGIKIKVPEKGKKNNSYIFITGGFQNPVFYKLPVIPEFPINMVLDGYSAKASGWFAGFGIMKKGKSNFEVGILADFYKTTIPVAFEGQRAKGDWVFEQTANTSYFTDTFLTDMNRVSEVIAIRAAVRYKIPVGKIHFWGGVAPGTFSSKVYFSEGGFDQAHKTSIQTTAGITFQTGVNFVVRNKIGKDILRFTFYSDFVSPKIEEKIVGLFKPSWIYRNTDRNFAISPIRFGFAIGIH